MQLISQSFQDGQRIPGEFAFAVPDAASHVALSSNRNPHLAWSDVPDGTRSFVLVCHDPDVPSKGDDVNQEGREVPFSLPRVDFFHWLLLDIPAHVRSIAAGAHSDGVTPRGKTGAAAPEGWRHGLNDYTGWFAADEQMKGTTSAMTALARPGTTHGSIITCSPSMPWRRPRWRCPGP
jgi:phosphatidylethanolamine-binding protein (PEBP) family uncharacterized protein